MTRIESSLVREPQEATPRQRLTPVQRVSILARQHDLCAGCNETLVWTVIEGKRVYGPMIDEHIVPLDLGGSNDLSNRELRCIPCAKAKTREDMKRIAKARRLRIKHGPPELRPKAQPIRSRGFQSRWERS
jgi:5-methylcytosine-specific restriction endonuclease McrA